MKFRFFFHENRIVSMRDGEGSVYDRDGLSQVNTCVSCINYHISIFKTATIRMIGSDFLQKTGDFLKKTDHNKNFEMD